MKKTKFLLCCVLLAAFVMLFALPYIAYAAEDGGMLVISRDTEHVRYGKAVVYTAYYTSDETDYSGEYMWFVNDVKQDETSDTFTYVHKESGDAAVYAKYGNLTSNTLTASINYSRIELWVYYGLAAVALFGGIPFLIALSRNKKRSPIEAVYADTIRLFRETKKLGEQLNSDKKVKDIILIRLSFSLSAASDTALLYYEDTQIAALQVAADKFKDAYYYIHGIKTAMPKAESVEKAYLALERLTEIDEVLKPALPLPRLEGKK